MKIRVGFEMIYDFPQPTPLIALVGTHFTRASDIIVPDHLTTSPSVPITPYRDGFGNWCSRLVAPAGRMRLAADGTVRDSGLPDVIAASAWQHAVEDLPAEAIVYLLGSRYCETDRLSDIAWKLFEKTTPGWARVQAICDFVHNHIAFGYEHARATMTACEVFNERKGVCRDYNTRRTPRRSRPWSSPSPRASARLREPISRRNMVFRPSSRMRPSRSRWRGCPQRSPCLSGPRGARWRRPSKI